MEYIDLHVHSTASDGTYAPSELVSYAKEKDLKAFALTDHDTVCGISEAMAAAKGTGLECIPGIEFSTDYNGKDVHIIGLYIRCEDPNFHKELDKFVDSRSVRNEKMCKNLQGIGIDITVKAMEDAYPNSVITRAHFARYMVEHGIVASRSDAFDKYLGDHTKYYVNREKVSPEDAIKMILRFGGVPVLAHPILYHMSDCNLDHLVASLKQEGLVAIETLYSTYTPSEQRQIEALATKYELLPSGGSDFHGANKKRIDLGIGYGNLQIPYTFLEDIKKWTNNHRSKVQ